jgi:hypothetical protein
MSKVNLKVINVDEDLVLWIEERFRGYDTETFSAAVNRLLRYQKIRMEEQDEFDNISKMLRLISQSSVESLMILRNKYLPEPESQKALSLSVKSKIEEALAT